MSREQIVRDTAYAIWEAEGKPEGRDAEHWRQAEARVADSLKGGAVKPGPSGKASAPAKGKVPTEAAKAPAAANPPAKAGAIRKAPSKKT